MPTVEEVLRQSGFTDEQIAGLDKRAITAFSGVLTEADKERLEAKEARDAAELAQRSNVDFYENRIAPSLTAWEEEKQRIENEKARMAAEAAFYKTQAEEAKKSGFIAADVPGFDASKFTPPNPGVQPRDAGGRYVANAPGGTPGSPQYFDVNRVYETAGAAVGVISDIDWRYRQLYGKPMPILPTELIRQADAQKLDPMAYASRTFNFEGRQQQMAQEAKQAEEERIRKEAIAPWELKVKEAEEAGKKALVDRDREWAEKVGSNPDTRKLMSTPQYTDVQKAIASKDMPDPTMLNDQQRRALTSQMIRKDIEGNMN